MNKLDLESKKLVSDNISKIKELFPNVVTEGENGLVIDFDLLKHELSSDIVEGVKERYQLTWPGKKEAINNANTPTNKTLRPLKDKSVDFDKTNNIYIEGDNLEVLKVLCESYVNKVNCIYIDPPYNTGENFIYNDSFYKDKHTELYDSGLIDELGNKFISNSRSNGKFHSDWLKMMYSRLKISHNFLKHDGV
ncbi:MAG: DNA methyltransferase, partial [Peptostreptococcaceae bacterium]